METTLEYYGSETAHPHYSALLERFSAEEKASFEKHVGPDRVAQMASWIGGREEVERILFWDRWGKYDDPEWRWLSPVDALSQELHEHVGHYYRQLKVDAVDIQMRSDLSLYSQYNSALLFTGMAGALRCNAEGIEDDRGGFFKGLELRCIGSVEENANTVTLYPLHSGGIEVHFGSRIHGRPMGIQVYSGDSYSLLQLAKLIDRDLVKFDFETLLCDNTGAPVMLDPKAIRKAARKGRGLPIDSELRLFARTRAENVGDAMEKADAPPSEEACMALFDKYFCRDG